MNYDYMYDCEWVMFAWFESQLTTSWVSRSSFIQIDQYIPTATDAQIQTYIHCITNSNRITIKWLKVEIRIRIYGKCGVETNTIKNKQYKILFSKYLYNFCYCNKSFLFIIDIMLIQYNKYEINMHLTY